MPLSFVKGEFNKGVTAIEPRQCAGFKGKLRHVFLRNAVIPILFVLLTVPIFMIMAEKLRIDNDAYRANCHAGELIQEVHDSYCNEILRMSNLERVINFIKTKRDANLVYDDFYKFNNAQKVKSTLHIINKEGVIVVSSTPSEPETDNKVLKGILPRIQKNSPRTLMEANYFEYSHRRHTVYTFGRAIEDESEVIGYIVYQLFEDDLQKLIFTENAELTVVTDQYDRIIVATNNIVKGLMNKFLPTYSDSGKYIIIKDGRYHVSSMNLNDESISVYTLVSARYNPMVFAYYGVFCILLSLFLLFVTNYLATKVSDEATNPIDKLLNAVKGLQEGDMSSYVKIKSGDEFEILANQYNIMLDRLNELIRKNDEQYNIRRLTEIKFLQGQFQPHFIFNILEILRYAITIEPKQAEDIIITLSRLLRYSARSDPQSVRFREDLEYIKDYLKLHKFRYKDRLNYLIEISEEVKNASVPKLVLQPIIENSIKHGYRKKDHLTIEMFGYISGKDIVFEIKDNGDGITEENMDFIREMLRGSQNNGINIGLYNVHRRIELLFGEPYGVGVESTFGIGTSVRVIIPKSS